MKRTLYHLPGGVKALIVSVSIIMFICGAGLGMLAFSPSVGANGADVLRKIIGDQNVAALETVLFQGQDALKQLEFHLGILKSNTDPFGQTVSLPAANPSAPIAEGKGSGNLSLPPVSTPITSIPVTGKPAPESASPQKSGQKAIVGGELTASSARGESGATWIIHPATAMGSQPGEGQWQPYLQDASGKTVAYRTFVQPDPQRPYALTGIVAFDLTNTRLHYLIGSNEPYAPGTGPKQTGSIPSADAAPGVLLAAFNGGFKYEHGHFGSMANGFTSAPLMDGLSAIAIYKDGSVRIGEWGKDIQNSADLVALRQNGPLVVQNGQITAQVDNDNLWGRTISGGVVTWRSGMAISPDGKTLYYFAGPSLSIHTLASAMLAVHPAAAMQLDINNYWVHFVSILSKNNQPTVEALFPDVMRSNKERFLRPYPRDFFYVTTVQ